MSPETVMTQMQAAIELMLKLSGPLLLSGLVVGIVVGIFQAVTQIQEMTLTFVPKILITVLVTMLAFPWMLQTMMDYTANLLQNIPNLAR